MTATAAAIPPKARDADPDPYRLRRYPSRLVERVTLRDGRSVLVRPILPQDADLEQNFFAQLAPQTRQRRFHFGVNLLPPEVVRGFAEIDYHTHLALVAEAVDSDEQPMLVADARYVVRAGSDSAEFAIVVADAWQRVGLGRDLMQRLAGQARRDGVRVLLGDVLTHNQPMLTLARALGARVVPHRHEASLQQARWVL